MACTNFSLLQNLQGHALSTFFNQSINQLHSVSLGLTGEESTDNVYEISGNAEFELNKSFNAVMEHTKVQVS